MDKEEILLTTDVGKWNKKMPTFLQMNVYTLFKKYPPSNASDSYMLAKFDAIVIRRKHRQQHNHPVSLGNCDIDFFNFCRCKVQNFKILNLYKWNQNFRGIFWNFTKVKPIVNKVLQNFTKWNWNFVNYC